jgi:hypothetical protein
MQLNFQNLTLDFNVWKKRFKMGNKYYSKKNRDVLRLKNLI